MKFLKELAAGTMALALAGSLGSGALATDSGRGSDWTENEAAIRAAELCENWSGNQGQRKRNADGRERWERDNLLAGERLYAVEQGRRHAERLVRDRGCESEEVRYLLGLFHEFIEPLFD
jgi:hypothetical protein